MERVLTTKRLLIADITGPPGPFNPTDFYNEITELLTINKRTTTTKLDNVQVDFGAFHTNFQQLKNIQKIQPAQTIIVTWELGCRMAYHTTAQPLFQ